MCFFKQPAKYSMQMPVLFCIRKKIIQRGKNDAVYKWKAA